jgi:nucleoid DNA-binding protein
MRSFPHLQRDVALKIVDDFIEEIAAGLIQEQSAKIHGFGSFEVVTKKEQVRKIEKNRNFVIVPARRRVIFKAGKNLLESMNASQ